MSEINELKELIITLTKEVQELKLEVLGGKSTKSKKEVKRETYDMNGNKSECNYLPDELKEIVGDEEDFKNIESVILNLYKYGKFTKVSNLQMFTRLDKCTVEDCLEILKEKKFAYESKKYYPTSWIISDKGRDFLEGKL